MTSSAPTEPINPRRGRAGGRKVLAAVRALPELARRQESRKPLLPKEVDASLVTAAWRRAVFANAGLPAGAVDRDAYVVCVLEPYPGADGAGCVRLAVAAVGRSACSPAGRA